jgi:hypothetical protein
MRIRIPELMKKILVFGEGLHRGLQQPVGPDPGGDEGAAQGRGGDAGGRAALPGSVADPDPHVFGPPGSGSTSKRYGSGSESFSNHAKIVRKTFIPTILGLLLTFYL